MDCALGFCPSTSINAARSGGEAGRVSIAGKSQSTKASGWVVQRAASLDAPAVSISARRCPAERSSASRVLRSWGREVTI